MSLVNIGNTVPGDIGSSGDQGLNVAALKIVVPNDGFYKLLSLSQIVTTAGGASLRLGMYDDTGTQTFWPTGGAPGALLAETAPTALVDGLNTLPVLVPKIIPAGGRWINYNQSANVVWTQHDTHIQGRSLFYIAPFAPFDNPFTPGSANDSAEYPVYATFDYTPFAQGGTSASGGGGYQGIQFSGKSIDVEELEVFKRINKRVEQGWGIEAILKDLETDEKEEPERKILIPKRRPLKKTTPRPALKPRLENILKEAKDVKEMLLNLQKEYDERRRQAEDDEDDADLLILASRIV